MRARAMSISKKMKLDSGEDVDDETLRNSIFCDIVPHSFVGSTLVLMADGASQPIDQIKIGDKVSSSDPNGSGGLQAHTVTAVHVTDDDREFVDVDVSTGSGIQTVTATVNHPFWDKTTNTWTPAVDLKPGDRLDTPGVTDSIVSSIKIRIQDVRTYDLTVDGLHDYFVVAGGAPILVHNNGTGDYYVPDDTVLVFGGATNPFENLAVARCRLRWGGKWLTLPLRCLTTRCLRPLRARSESVVARLSTHRRILVAE